MVKLWPVIAVAAAGLLAAVLLLGGGEDVARTPDGEEIVGYDERGNPILLTSDSARRPKPTTTPEVRPGPPVIAPDAGAMRVLFLQGLVLAAEGGTPIPNARLWVEPSAQPCPRLPMRPAFDPWLASVLEPSGILSEESGRFAWRVQPAGVAAPGLYDVFVSARGYVGAVLCRPDTGAEFTVRLAKALTLPVQVTDRQGRPLEGATLVLAPAPGTPAIPGHGGEGISAKDGRVVIDGLLPGPLTLTADHPAFMPQTLGPLDPDARIEVAVRLAPALRLTFEIRSDEGSEVRNPTLAWETNGTPAHEGLTLMAATPSGPHNAPLAEVRTESVRIPCDHREVRLEIKADGYEPWQPPAEPLPPEGGERTVVVSLRRNTSLTSLTVRFEDTDGKPVDYAGMRPVLTVTRLDGQGTRSGIRIDTTATLGFPDLPAGPYRIGVRSPEHAPAETDVTVVAGEANETLVRLGPPARLRVRFTAPQALLVRFRLLHQGREIPAFPEHAPAPDAAKDPQPLVAAGADGALFSGLPAGACTIEVTSPELVAAPRTVQLRVGEITEVEIDVGIR